MGEEVGRLRHKGVMAGWRVSKPHLVSLLLLGIVLGDMSWKQGGGSWDHTGVSPNALSAGTNASILSEFSLGFRVSTKVIRASNGTFFLGNDASQILAMNFDSKTTIWATSIPGVRYGMSPALSHDEKTLYVVTGGAIFLLDSSTGGIISISPVCSQVTSVTVGPSGTLYLNSPKSLCVVSATGESLWKVEKPVLRPAWKDFRSDGKDPQATPVAVDDQETVAVIGYSASGSGNADMIAYDLVNRTFKWAHTVPSAGPTMAFLAAPLIHKNKVFAAMVGKGLIITDLFTGTLLNAPPPYITYIEYRQASFPPALLRTNSSEFLFLGISSGFEYSTSHVTVLDLQGETLDGDSTQIEINGKLYYITVSAQPVSSSNGYVLVPFANSGGWGFIRVYSFGENGLVKLWQSDYIKVTQELFLNDDGSFWAIDDYGKVSRFFLSNPGLDISKAPTTDPNASKAPVTDPNASKAPATDPNASKAPATDPNASKAPATDPNASKAPTTDLNASNAPTTDPNGSKAPPREGDKTSTGDKSGDKKRVSNIASAAIAVPVLLIAVIAAGYISRVRSRSRPLTDHYAMSSQDQPSQASRLGE